ncbi:coil containing protein [Vibrio phage 1.184.A._10N.286.49.A5]|nr:coil containing protein [Vibrio phage 1.184.A._10N.286.49.A5]
MKLYNIEQGTDAWLKLREDHLTASDASAMMGASKYKSRTQLMKEKKFGVKEKITPAKQALFDKGHAAEDAARDLLEVDMLESFDPVVGGIEIDGLKLLASLDGLSEDQQMVFEHKLWNETLAENVRNNVLEETHYWQLEHQLLVSGAENALFMTSDGTADKREYMHYISIPERREQLIAGWKQFNKDLESFEMEAKKEVVVAEKTSLPAISYSVTGTEITTNIAMCLDQIKTMASEEMSKVLETDQDFADKDQLNKDVKKARAGLKDMIGKVRGEFVSYSQFEEIAQEMDGVLQQMQSHGEKQVKQAKEAKKTAIRQDAERELQNHIFEANQKLAPMNILNIIGGIETDWAGAMKNKRTIESLTNSVSEELAKWKVEINQVMDRVVPNLQYLRDHAADYKFLFSDAQQLVNQDAEPFQAIIKSRIADHKQAEEERLEAERKRIQEEEERKAKEKAEREAEAKAEAERERIRKEERAKAQAEEQAKREQEEADRLQREAEEKAKQPEPNLISEEDEAIFNDCVADAKPGQASTTAKKYQVRVEWSGYSRGYSVYEVEAESEDEAKEICYEGDKLEHVVVRDDTESQEVNIIK